MLGNKLSIIMYTNIFNCKCIYNMSTFQILETFTQTHLTNMIYKHTLFLILSRTYYCYYVSELIIKIHCLNFYCFSFSFTFRFFLLFYDDCTSVFNTTIKQWRHFDVLTFHVTFSIKKKIIHNEHIHQHEKKKMEQHRVTTVITL